MQIQSKKGTQEKKTEKKKESEIMNCDKLRALEINRKFVGFG